MGTNLFDMTPQERKEAREHGEKLFNEILSKFIDDNPHGRGDFMKTLKKKYKGTFLKSFTENSKATAIKAKCLDCTCFQKSEIENCPIPICPLWDHRPYQKKGE